MWQCGRELLCLHSSVGKLVKSIWRRQQTTVIVWQFYLLTYQHFSCWIFPFTWLHLHGLLFAFPLKLILIIPLSRLLLFSYRTALMSNRGTFNQMKLQVWVLTMDCRINSDVTHWSAHSCLFTSYASWTNQKIDLPTSCLCWLDEFTSSGSFFGGIL